MCPISKNCSSRSVCEKEKKENVTGAVLGFAGLKDVVTKSSVEVGGGSVILVDEGSGVLVEVSETFVVRSLGMEVVVVVLAALRSLADFLCSNGH